MYCSVCVQAFLLAMRVNKIFLLAKRVHVIFLLDERLKTIFLLAGGVNPLPSESTSAA